MTMIVCALRKIVDGRVALLSDRGDIRRRLPRHVFRDVYDNDCLRVAQTVALESDPPVIPSPKL